MKKIVIVIRGIYLISCSNKREEIIGEWVRMNEDTKNIDSTIIYKINATYIQEISNDNYSKTRKYNYIDGDTIYLKFGSGDLKKWAPSYYVVEADKKNLTLQLFFGEKLGNSKMYFERKSNKLLEIDPKDDVRYLFKGTNMFDMTDSLTVDSLYNSFRGV